MHGVRIGISGWRYKGWRGTFYPPDLPQRRELVFAASRLNSIEINGSFYSLQRPEYYAAWFDQTPDDFVFAVKGGRFITHMKKLRDVNDAVANFFASGVLKLGHKLGPILWQFPPRMVFDADRFESFLAMLPLDTDEAAKCARRHTAMLRGRAHTRAEVHQPVRHAFEVRHESFVTPEFAAMLRRHNAAWVIADAATLWPFYEEITADFVYCRLHGATELYASGYSEPELRRWAHRVSAWHAGRSPRNARRFTRDPVKPAAARDVYVYFDNDAKVHAPFNAMRLAQLTAERRRGARGTPPRRRPGRDAPDRFVLHSPPHVNASDRIRPEQDLRRPHAVRRRVAGHRRR